MCAPFPPRFLFYILSAFVYYVCITGAKVFGLVSSRSKAEQALAAGADKVYISSSPTNDFTAETDKRISYSLLDILKDTDNKVRKIVYSCKRTFLR